MRSETIEGRAIFRKIGVTSIAAAMAVLATAMPTKAVTVSVTLSPGTGAAYVGTSLATSTAFQFVDTAVIGSAQVGPNPTPPVFFTLGAGAIVYGPGSNTPLALVPDFIKTFVQGSITYTETLSSVFAFDRTSVAGVDTISLYLKGVIIGAGLGNLIVIAQPVSFILTASQTGAGPVHWTGTEASSVAPLPTPLPSALVLFGSVIAGVRVFMRRRAVV